MHVVQYVCMHIHTRLYFKISTLYMFVCMYVYIYIYIFYAQDLKFMYVCMYACMHVCMYVCVTDHELSIVV